YPGNVRELRNIVTRCSIVSNSNIIDRSVVEHAITGLAPQYATESDPVTVRLNPGAGAAVATLRDMERRHLDYLMQHFANNKDAVAQAAGISVRSLYRKLAARE
ncbi:MAG: helix-turn-helix domain-containing protein, partial [Chromatocurvus sp.]